VSGSDNLQEIIGSYKTIYLLTTKGIDFTFSQSVGENFEN